MADWAKYLQEEPCSGLSSRSYLYLHSNEIFQTLQKSYDGTDNQLKFNFAITKDKLEQVYGASLIDQVLAGGD